MKRIWLRDARRKAKLTQAELAKRIGSPQSYISKLELGLIDDPGFQSVIDLSAALNVEPLALRFGERDAAA
jgi:transcriptional regulator with XRE-family HTH domain